MVDNFLNLPIFISISHILANLFLYGYSFAFPLNVKNATQIYVSLGFVQYFVLLLITLTPAAATNQAGAIDGLGNCSVFASLVSKAVPHHKSACAP
ncbi:hypothetical protein CEXT_219771 [Caerostris extrusa]|uniref:Uncharacterized protein n=1 Tax=Caerostris extrusa TaxID=172846 RepID=A0AAV4QTF5_CAEEX|nr:hypothetical protein CEXT_219771 [Caerostris extrusa]